MSATLADKTGGSSKIGGDPTGEDIEIVKNIMKEKEKKAKNSPSVSQLRREANRRR